MEILIGAAIIILLLIILGVSIWTIMQGDLWIMAILLMLMDWFFLISLFFIIAGKPHDAQFVRIHKQRKWGTAVYLIDGKEYLNWYPAEFIFQNKIYHEDRTCRVRLWQCKRFYLLFDWYSILIAAIGVPLSAIGVVLFCYVLMQLMV